MFCERAKVEYTMQITSPRELRGWMKTLLLAAVKVILTLGLFALALRSVDIGDVLLHIRQLPLSLLVLTIALLFCQMLAVSIRMSTIAGMIKSRVPLRTSFRINWIGS